MKFIDDLVYSISRKFNGSGEIKEDKEWTELKKEIKKLRRDKEYLEKADRISETSSM